MGRLLGCLLAISVALAETATAEQSPEEAEAEILEQILDILNNLPESTSGSADLGKQPQNAQSDTSSADQKTSGQSPRGNVDISVLPRRSPFENIPNIPRPSSSMPSSPSASMPSSPARPGSPSQSKPSSSSQSGSSSSPQSRPGSPSQSGSSNSSQSRPSSSSQSGSSSQNNRPSNTNNQRAGKTASSDTSKSSSGPTGTNNSGNNPTGSSAGSQTQQNGKNSHTNQSSNSKQGSYGRHSANNSGTSSGTSKTSQDPFPVFTDPEESEPAQRSQSAQSQDQSGESSFDAMLSDLEVSILEHARQGAPHIPDSGGLSNEAAGSEAEANGENNQGGTGQSSSKSPPWQTALPVPPGDSRPGQVSQRGQSGSNSSGPNDKEEEIPDDLKGIDNDDIIAQQLKEAAIAETDPELKEKLWQEYRKYKGL